MEAYNECSSSSCSALLKGLSTSMQTYWQLYCGFEKPHSFLAHNSKKRKMNNIKRDIFFKILQIINICEKSCERKPSNFTMACFWRTWFNIAILPPPTFINNLYCCYFVSQKPASCKYQVQ